MKTYKQAKIPKGYVEIRMRGSHEEAGSLSFKKIVPTRYAAEAIGYLMQAPKPKKVTE